MKYHYANSAEPLHEGGDVYAICGAVIPKAKFAALIDCGVVGYSFAMQSHRGMCRKCWNRDVPERFVYIVSSGQHAKDSATGTAE